VPAARRAAGAAGLRAEALRIREPEQFFHDPGLCCRAAAWPGFGSQCPLGLWYLWLTRSVGRSADVLAIKFESAILASYSSGPGLHGQAAPADSCTQRDIWRNAQVQAPEHGRENSLLGADLPPGPYD
jgi:hypothetical protein